MDRYGHIWPALARGHSDTERFGAHTPAGHARTSAESDPEPDAVRQDPHTAFARHQQVQKRPRLSRPDETEEHPVNMTYGYYGQVVPGDLHMQVYKTNDSTWSRDLEHPILNVFKPDDSSYFSQNNNCIIVLQHPGSTLFEVTEIVIKAPDLNYTQHVREGLAYVTMSTDDLVGSGHYHSLNDSATALIQQIDQFRRRAAQHLQHGRRSPVNGMDWEVGNARPDMSARDQVWDEMARLQADLANAMPGATSIVFRDENGDENDDDDDSDSDSDSSDSSDGIDDGEIDEDDVSDNDDDDDDDEMDEIASDVRVNVDSWTGVGMSSPSAANSRRRSRRSASRSRSGPLTEMLLPHERRSLDPFARFLADPVGSTFSTSTRRETRTHRARLAETVFDARRQDRLAMHDFREAGIPFQESVPQCKFYIPKGGNNQCRIVFDPPTAARFILLKMNSRAPGNIEIKNITVKGYYGPRYFPSVEMR